jgi:ketosteroid isomerase-like protein
MKKLMKVIGIMIFSLFAVVVGMPQERSQSQGDKKSEAEIRKALADWVDATNRRDMAAAGAIWDKNVVGWFPESREFSPLAAFEVAGIPAKKGASYSTYEIKIDEIAVSGSLAAVYDLWTETKHFDGSNVTVKRLIRSSELWKRQPDGKWKITRWVSTPEKWVKANE